MELVINYFLAWITVIIGVFLSSKYIIRKLAESSTSHKKLFQKLNKYMRKCHITLGVVMFITGFFHGLFSSQNVFSLNLGTITWIVGLITGISYITRKLFKKRNVWLFIHRILTLIFLFFIVFHIVHVRRIKISSDIINYNDNMTENTNTPAYEAEGEKNDVLDEYNENLFGVILKDGTYIGVATGFREGLTVEVTIFENQVTKISVISHNEKNARFYEKPINEIPVKIVNAQSLDVDAVSGATYTSIGIINAVNDALSQAVVSGELPPIKKLR